MLKNAIESANYYHDSRDRRNKPCLHSCQTSRLFHEICGASNYGRFSSHPTPFMILRLMGWRQYLSGFFYRYRSPKARREKPSEA
jgi:hypothetical protein